jgi:3',5'-cyclic AMP phosphodiesterase CpdA
VILTDIHIGSARRDVLARQAIADINEIAPEFVVVPGDITEDGEPQQFLEFRSILDELACPYYVVPGNHDVIQRSTREPRCEEFWRAAFGTEPVDHVVECGDLQIALVDSTDPTASPFPDWDVSKGSVGGEAAGVDSGALRPGQIEELVARLDKNKPVLLVQHHELHPFPGFPPVKFALREEDSEAELAALKDFNLIGVIAGHTHRSARLQVGDGSVTQLEIPSLKDWPFAFSVAGLSDDGLQVVVRQISDREAIWSFAKGLLPLMRRFAIGPLSDLSAKLPI